MLTNSVWRARGMVLSLLASFVVGLVMPVAAGAQDIADIVSAFQTATNPAQRQSLAETIIRRYPEYEKLIASDMKGAGKLARVAKGIDKEITKCVKEVMNDVGQKGGGDMVDVVLAGSHGTGVGFTPGVSDHDFIPRGKDGGKFAKDFNEAFQTRFKVPPGTAKINVLDPTNISSWPERLRAAADVEKYNTVGGNRWLERKLWDDNSKIWRVYGDGKTLHESVFRKIVTEEPVPLTAGDAAGLFSDNMRFIEKAKREAIEKSLSAEEQILKLAKYDFRNGIAVNLVSKLGPEETELIRIAKAIQESKNLKTVQELMKEYGSKVGKTGQEAAEAFLGNMGKLTEKMGQEIIANHVAMIAKSKTPVLLTEELAGALANLPADMSRRLTTEAAKRGMPPAALKDAMEMAEALRKTGAVHGLGEEGLEKMAQAMGHKVPFEKLGPAEKNLVREGLEEAASLRSKLFKLTGNALILGFSAYAIYEAYHATKEQGTGMAIGAGLGRGVLELMQIGYPPAMAAELLGRATALVVGLATSAYRNDVLDSLYERYKKSGNLDEALDHQAVLGYFAGGLREVVKEMRAAYPKITDEEIEAKIRQYFINRLETDRRNEAALKFIADAEEWMKKANVPMMPSGDLEDNEKLKKEDPALYARRLAILLKKHQELMEKLNRDGIDFPKDEAWRLLGVLYRGSWKDLEAAMTELYRKHFLLYKNGRVVGRLQEHEAATGPASRPQTMPAMPPGVLGKVVTAKDAQIAPVVMPPCPPGVVGKAGVLVERGGAFKQRPVDAGTDPPVVMGPFEVRAGGKLQARIVGTPPVRGGWSMYNNNSGLGISFQPRYADGYGTSQGLLKLSGQMKDNDLKGAAEWDGPGRITVVAYAACGAGPLTGGSFAQNWQARVEIVKMADTVPARGNVELHADDLVRTATAPTTILLADGSKLMIAPNSHVRVSQGGDGRILVTVEKGGVRLTDPSGRESRTDVLLGKATVKALDPEYVCEYDLATQKGRVAVVEGEVLVVQEGQVTSVTGGEQMDLPGGNVSPFEAPAAEVNGLAFADLVLGDLDPLGPGTITGRFCGGGIGSDWVWEDPGKDCKLATPEPGTLQVTVPNNNDLWGNKSSSPRLLHKVTGDFDLQAKLRVQCKGNHMATAEFVLFAPGSYLGFLANQMVDDGLLGHYRLLGNGWLRINNLNKLLLLGRKHAEGADPPDGPVHFRLTRRLDVWRTYWSLDGKTWCLSSREAIASPDTLYVGWVFKRMAYDRLGNEPALVTLGDVSLTNAQRGTLASPVWDRDFGLAGVEISGKSVRIRFDGTHAGLAGVESGLPLHQWAAVLAGDPQAGVSTAARPAAGSEESDFDVAVGIEAEAPDVKARQVCNMGVHLVTNDQRSHAYIEQRWQESKTNLLYFTDLMLDGRWGRQNTVQAQAPRGWLRLARSKGRIDAYYWQEGEWVPLLRPNTGFADWPYLSLSVGNYTNPKAPAAFTAAFEVEHVAVGPAATATVWMPREGRVLLPTEAPAGLKLPTGAQAEFLVAPFPLGAPMVNPGRGLYVCSMLRGKDKLIRIDSGVGNRLVARSDLFAGSYGKSGLVHNQAPPGGPQEFLVAVNIYPSTDIRFRGLYILDSQGKINPVKTDRGHDGISDIVAAPGGGWFFSDFIDDNIWHLPGLGQKESPLITKGNPLGGIVSITRDPAGQLYALNANSGHPVTGENALYLIDKDHSAKLIAKAPPGATWAAVTVSQGGPLGKAILICDSTGNQIVRVGLDGRIGPLVTGLEKPSAIRADGTNGDVWILAGKDGRQLVHLHAPRSEGAAPARPEARPPISPASRPAGAQAARPKPKYQLTQEQAVEALAGGRNARALELAELAAKQAADEFGARRVEAVQGLFFLGQVQARAGKGEQADQTYDKAKAQATGISFGKQILGDIRVAQAERAAAKGRRPEAIRMLMEAQDVYLAFTDSPRDLAGKLRHLAEALDGVGLRKQADAARKRAQEEENRPEPPKPPARPSR